VTILNSEKNVNKGAVAKIIAEKLEIPYDVAMDMIDVYSDIVMTTLVNGGRVSILGFGAFYPDARAARQSRNPQTNEPCIIPARVLPKFIPCMRFKKQMIECLKVKDEDLKKKRGTPNSKLTED